MSKPAPVVAELGRPETPQETAERKAAFSKAYRSSQTFRGLIAALIMTLAVVLVVVFAVPRGEPVEAEKIDVAGIAADVSSTMDSPAIVPELGSFWRVNAAELKSGATVVWDITLAPAAEDERGFIRIAQAFDADSSWAPQQLDGTAAEGTIEIGGLTWDVYDLGTRDDNVTNAIGTQAGDDYVLLFGSRSAESTQKLAESLIPQIKEIAEAP